jgi:putative nucleotidyltransferase with HDIG domain
VAIALGLERHRSAFEIWWKNFTWLAVNYFSGASVAAVIVTYTKRLDSSALISTLVIIVPLLVVSYLTFRTAMGRVEDSNQHLSELNRLYLSTIETLAMAIDAKDQITHGHIRRVQTYAVGLARRIGVTDDKLIKAIEAAALLHDMGKLAVPEYILNKPGKLTPAEFEKMKLHATVGADILSAIHFPYPVVPIVRHHHENWDGTGYPAGLTSTDIPIGARILAVVDCFDALTSDRPYRPRLSDGEALRILLDRRGSMYDPLIVDKFAAVHRDIAPDSLGFAPPRHALSDLIGSTQTIASADEQHRFDEITASSEEMLTLYELARAVARQTGLPDTADVIAQHLKRLIPSSLCVFYVFDPSTDDIEARHAVGDGASLVRGMRMDLGTRLSGWVAANRQTICNSDPVLDLGDAARSHALNLRSCLSTPLLSGDTLVGVLALYSGEVNAFTDNHRRVLEVAAKQVADSLERVREVQSITRGDILATLPSIAQLDQIVMAATGDSSGRSLRIALLLVEVVRMKQLDTSPSKYDADQLLRQIVQQLRAALRATDSLFRSDDLNFVVFLSDTDLQTTDAIAARLRTCVRENVLIHDSMIDVVVTSIPLPTPGTSMNDLIAAARIRGATPRQSTQRSVVH